MSGPSYVRVYPTDWRSGCLGLSLEQEGLYIRICMFIAETGRRVPLDDTEASRMMGTQTRNYRRVLGELLRLGKLKRHENGYGNDRIEHERSRSQNGIKQASDQEHSAASSIGTNRQTDQEQQRENTTPAIANDDVSQIHSRSTPVITELAGEKAEQNQQPFIEPEPEPNKKEDNPLTPKGGGVSHFEALNAFEAYNARALLLGLPQASKLTPDRQRRISARLKDFGSDGWAKALANLDTPFLRGLTAHRFRADLDFICQPKSFSKLHDGGYAPAETKSGVTHATDRNSSPRTLSIRERALAAIERGSAIADAHFAGQSGRG